MTGPVRRIDSDVPAETHDVEDVSRMHESSHCRYEGQDGNTWRTHPRPYDEGEGSHVTAVVLESAGIAIKG